MPDTKTFLHSLLSVPGLSGFEEPVSKLIEEKWRPLVDEISTSRLGSLHAFRKAASSEKRPSLMIAAHMDAIGLMVRQIENGYLLITQVGGVDPRILPGQAVTVHGRRDLPGVVQMLPDRLLKSSLAGTPPDFSRLFVDTGLKKMNCGNWSESAILSHFPNPPFKWVMIILPDTAWITGHPWRP